MAPIKSAVCGSQGHDINSFVTGETLIPGTQVWSKKYELLCTKCGSSLEDIRKERIRNDAPRVRKAKLTPAEPQPNPVEAV